LTGETEGDRETEVTRCPNRNWKPTPPQIISKDKSIDIVRALYFALICGSNPEISVAVRTSNGLGFLKNMMGDFRNTDFISG